MLRLQHSIRKQTLNIETDSEALALALQPRLGDINRRYLLPVIEKVFNEFSVSDRQIKIARLDVDLGNLPLDRFEELAAERFYQELRRALREALSEPDESPTANHRSQSKQTSHLELLQHYLQQGTLPFWAPRAQTFNFEEFLLELAAGDPDGLVVMIRKHGTQKHVIERLVLQLTEGLLRRLLGLLDPVHAALIIAYMIDLQKTHHIEPVLALSDQEFNRFVWKLVLSYTVEESGSQFNRRSFVKRLLKDLGRSGGLEYPEVIVMVQGALRQTEKHNPLTSSLPAVISELAREFDLDHAESRSSTIRISRPEHQLEERSDEGSAALANKLQPGLRTGEARRELDASLASDHRFGPAQSSRLDLLEHYLLHGTLPFRSMLRPGFSFAELVAELAHDDSAGLVALIAKLGHQKHAHERLVLQLGEAALQRLLALLDPEHAMLIIAYLSDLRKIHRVEPLRLLGDKEFAQQLWIIVLSYPARDPGSQFSRQSFLRWLLERMAQSQGLEFPELIATIQLSLQKIEKDHPFQSSLPANLRELIYELGETESSKRSDAKENDQATVQTSARDSGPPEDDASGVFRAALAELNLYLSTEQWTTARTWLMKPQSRGVLRFLAAHDAQLTRQFLLEFARSEVGLPKVANRLLRAFPPEELLAVMAFREQEFVARLIEVVGSFGEETPRVGTIQPGTLHGILWQTVLEYLLRESSGRWNRRTLVRRVVAAGAKCLGKMPASLAGMSLSALASAMRQAAGTVEVSLAQSLRAIEPTSSKKSHSPRLSFARYDQVEVLRYYLRYGILPWGTVLVHPELTSESLLASLSSFPRSLLLAVFDEEPPDGQLRALRAVRMIPEESLSRLLLRILPALSEADSLLGSALSECAARTEDKQVFYARLIAVILSGHCLDLEKFAGPAFVQLGPEAAAPAPQDDPGRWEAHVLKSAIADRLRFENTSNADRPPLADLLHTLVETYPEEARHFCRAIRDTPLLLTALIKLCSPTLFDRLVDLLSPGASQTLNALLQCLAAIPLAHRTHSGESLRQVVFHELLRLDDLRSLDNGFLFTRVIQRLFSTSPSYEVRQLLLREAAALKTSGNLPVAHISAFEVAITGGRQEPATGRRSSVSGNEAFVLLEPERLEPSPGGHPRERVGPRPSELISDDALRHTLFVTLENYPEEVYPFIIRYVRDPEKREHWVEMLGESILARLTYLLEPRMHRTLIDAAEVLASAWLETAPSVNSTLTERRLFWTFLLEFLSQTTPENRSVEHLVHAFFEHIATLYQATAPGASERLSTGTELLEQADHLAGASGRANLRAVLQRYRTRLLSPWLSSASLEDRETLPLSENNRQAIEGQRPDPHPRPRPDRSQTAFSMRVEQDDDVATEPTYIDNAGLVLIGPFLPHLFQTLDLLHQDASGRTRLRSHEAGSRAVHLLQYMVGGRTDVPEPVLVLNKILCGLPTGAPVAREIKLTDVERDLCEQLLKSVIANWKIISNTSIAGLQETFIKRDGRLERSDQGWKLKIQRKTLDVLVDQIPWNISIIYHRWMPQPIYVEW